MKNLIYYPTFEPHRIEWLKYALIHIDQFSPIIPEKGKSKVSSLFKRISEETDLIKIHKPTLDQADRAATKALKEIEFIERNPEQYRDKLNNVNVSRSWKDSKNWTYKLYEEKFNSPFKFKCIDNGLGAECSEGLSTSKELTHLYMTFLAEEIAFEKQGNPITDKEELNNLASYLRAKNSKNDELLDAARTVVHISLPKDISELDIQKFIEFRNESGIIELRSAFNSSLYKFYESVEEDFDPSDYLKSLEKTNKELSKEIGLFFGGCISAYLGGEILIQNPNNLEAIKQIIEGSLFTITGTTAINKAWNDGNEKRHARKFISKINSLKSK